MKFKKFFAVCTTVLLAVGLAGVGAVSASATDSNHPDFWETQPGEVCADVGYTTENSGTNPYMLPVLDETLVYSKVIVKAGSTGNSVINENEVYTTGLTPGATFVHTEKGSISHVIVCTVPAPPTEDAAASATATTATCLAAGGVNFGLTNATWENETDLTDGSRTAIANDGHVFLGGASTLVVTYTIALQLTGEECDPPEDPEDATASATPTDATCLAPGGVDFGLTNATWENDTDLTDGSRTATANDGHLFANGESTLVVTYTIALQLTGEQCDPPAFCVGADVDWEHAGDDVSWEVRLGRTIADRNASALYLPTDFGGLLSITGFDESLGNGDNMYVHSPADIGLTNVYRFADGTVLTATVGGDDNCAPAISWVLTPPILATCTTVTGTSALSSVEYVGDVLTLVTTEAEQGSWQVPFTGTLADIGTVLEVQANPASEVGLWIYVDGHGWIVYEEGQYNGNLWSKTVFEGIPAGSGYAASAPIEDYIALYGNLPAEAWLLYGTSEAGSTAVSSVTVGCTTYTFDFEPVVVEEVPAATFSDVCGTANDLVSTPDDTDALDYTETWNQAHNSVTVSVVAIGDNTIKEGVETSWSHTFTNDPCPTIRALAPSAFDPTCPAGVEAGESGYIQLELNDNLHYSIGGVPTTQAKNELAPGTYTISVTADSGFTLTGPASWDMTINPSFCPPTLALRSTTASMSNLTCSTAGSYTLADTEGVKGG